MPKIFLLVPLLTACGLPEGSFKTKNGVVVKLNGLEGSISIQEAEDMEDALRSYMIENHNYSKRLIDHCYSLVTVEMKEGPFPCFFLEKDGTLTETTCSGQQRTNVLWVSAFDYTGACAYRTAYIHEHLHWLHECVKWKSDYYHEGPEWQMANTPIKPCPEATSQSLLPLKCGSISLESEELHR